MNERMKRLCALPPAFVPMKNYLPRGLLLTDCKINWGCFCRGVHGTALPCSELLQFILISKSLLLQQVKKVEKGEMGFNEDAAVCRCLFSLRLQAMQLEFMMHSWLRGISHSSVRWSSNPIKERNFKWAGMARHTDEDVMGVTMETGTKRERK